jgi:putative oxidoreductase
MTTPPSMTIYRGCGETQSAGAILDRSGRQGCGSMSFWRRMAATHSSGWTILVRLLVGLVVFFQEGIQKLIFPGVLGAGRFANIGIPYPELMGPFVGVVEIACGALIIFGLFTRIAAVPLIIVMLIAIVSTKIPMWLGHDFWIFHAPKIARYGFWSMAHEGRADFTMLLALIYLLIEGSGAWSFDAMVAGRRKSGVSD